MCEKCLETYTKDELEFLEANAETLSDLIGSFKDSLIKQALEVYNKGGQIEKVTVSIELKSSREVENKPTEADEGDEVDMRDYDFFSNLAPDVPTKH